jgi:hypothetical protein
MAHGVTRSTVIKVQQTIHGYADGHRQLATSVTLKPRDIKTMLVLSDISGPGARIDDHGYLTGYPLPESTMYALARTWAAPEMPRPGCVWTHTLLIDFADLATLTNPASAILLFRRPNMGDVADYGTTLSVVGEHSRSNLSADAVNFARRILAGLYGKPTSRVIAARPAALDVDPVVMAVWAQQWPRLRRAFRFCTLSAADRSTESNVFDLQLLPSLDRSVRARFPDAVEIGNIGPPPEEWLDDAVSDLAQPDIAGLRTFLRRIGGDVDPGREAFRLLCRLHVLTQGFNTNPGAIGGAISLLDEELSSVQARTARGIVVTAALEQPDQLDDLALDFLVRHLEFAEPDAVSKRGGNLGREIWRRDPDRFARMVEGSDLHRSISASTFAALRVDELIDGIARAPMLSSVALAQRPELVAQPELWSRDMAPVDAAFGALASSPELRTAGVTAMIVANRDDLAMRAIREIGSFNVLQVLASLFDIATGDRRSLRPWLLAAASEPATVAQFLANGQCRSWRLLSAIAHLMPPDSVPNDYGVDPWVIAARAADGSTSGDTSLFLRAYLLSRALGSRSHSPGELAQLGFEPIYIAASAEQLPDEAWRVFEYRLPWSFKWFDWDRCLRIRAAVAGLFVDRELSFELFAQIASDDRVFAATAETVARSGRGRNFLKRVRRWMKDESTQRYAARIRVIERLVD